MPCIAWVDYGGAARTGRRTVQQVMAALAADGLVHHRTTLILGGASGHRQPASAFSKLMTAMAAPCTTVPVLRVAVQVLDADAKDFWNLWIPAIRMLRDKKNACCKVLLTARVREPLAHYLSAYEWATGGKTGLGNQLAHPRTIVRDGKEYSSLPRLAFARWAQPNMQVRTWVHGGSSEFITDEQTGKLPGTLPKQASRNHLELLLRTLESDFDLVYDVDEHFDDALTEIAGRLGLSANETALRYHRVSPRPKMYGGGLLGEAKRNARAVACPNMTACRELVRTIAPFDIILHERARRLFRPSSSSTSAQPRQPTASLERATPVTATGRSSRCAPAWLLSQGRELGDAVLRANSSSSSSTLGGHHLHQRPRAACREAKAASAVEAAAAIFGGTCIRTVSIDSMYEAVDDESHAALSLTSGAPVDGEKCELYGNAAMLRGAADATCAEVRVVFYFAPPPPPGVPPRYVGLPNIAPSACNIAFVDNRTRFGKDDSGSAEWAGGWRLHRLRHWPFARDGPRTAHYLKVIAPLLFPHAHVVLAGDVKCAGFGGGFPCALMRPAPGIDLHVAKNRWWRSRTLEGEFVSTWRHMRGRKMGASTFRQISAQLDAYEYSGDDMDVLFRMPDTFCMAWNAQRPASRAFACRLGYEVATRSMREQLSFDHARPPELNVSWWSMKVIGQFGNEQCVNNTTSNHGRLQRSIERGPLTHSASATIVDSLAPDTSISRQLSPLRRLSTSAHVGAATSSMPPAMLRHALCVTGLTRSFGEIGRLVRSRVLGFLRSTASASHIDTFGVQPRNDTWTPVFQYLGPFASVERQEPCRRAKAALPAFFTCTRGRAVHRLDSCTSSFVQMQCDLAHCDTMIRRHESAAVAEPYDYVTWMRLDVAWEVDLAAALPLPVHVAATSHNGMFIWLPQMNSQQAGLCDKFAFGTRLAMHHCRGLMVVVELVTCSPGSQATTPPCSALAHAPSLLVAARLQSHQTSIALIASTTTSRPCHATGKGSLPRGAALTLARSRCAILSPSSTRPRNAPSAQAAC